MTNNNARKNLDIITVMEHIRHFAHSCGEQDAYEFMLINHVLLDSIKRIAVQQTAEKKEIIAQLRDYVKKYIPKLSKCKSFRQESRNRRIIMRLNYLGLEKLSIALLSR